MTLLTASNLFFAMAPPAQPGQPAPPIWVTFGPMVLILIIFYFVLIYPQQKKQKLHDQMLKTLRAGDRICTSSGILGTVLAVKDKSVSLRSGDAKMEVLKSAVADIVERPGTPGAELKDKEKEPPLSKG